MSWTLAHNLQVRVNAVKSCYPKMVIGEVGDAAHKTEHSDHNPDSRNIVHAVDFMTETNEAQAKAILAWLASNPKDLEYWIHDRLIYTVANKYKPVKYTGTDPHTNHVHASGLHGSTGANAATGNGYSTSAEAMSPTGSPCTPEDDMDLTTKNLQDIADKVFDRDNGLMLAFPGTPTSAGKSISLNTWLNTMADKAVAQDAAIAELTALVKALGKPTA
jgi:hypothetical protein